MLIKAYSFSVFLISSLIHFYTFKCHEKKGKKVKKHIKIKFSISLERKIYKNLVSYFRSVMLINQLFNYWRKHENAVTFFNNCDSTMLKENFAFTQTEPS